MSWFGLCQDDAELSREYQHAGHNEPGRAFEPKRNALRGIAATLVPRCNVLVIFELQENTTSSRNGGIGATSPTFAEELQRSTTLTTTLQRR